MLYYVEDTPGAWSNPSNIQSVLIDDQCGQPFEANGYDLNTDGNTSDYALQNVETSNVFLSCSHCLKITPNVSFEFGNFGIFSALDLSYPFN